MSGVTSQPPETGLNTSTTRHSVRFSTKDASHKAFYAGFVKGMFSAFDGMVNLASSAPLRATFWQLLKPLGNAQIVYGAVALFIFLLMRDPADHPAELFWTISRWSRVITIATTFILEKRLKADSAMFFASLRLLNPAFADALQQHPRTKITFRHRLRNFKRVAKLGLFKLAGTFVDKLIPGGKSIAMPAVKFVSMRPVLGAPAAAGMAAIYILPSEFLESSRVDDVLISVGEAIIDADALGTDSVKEFAGRLQNDDVRAYFSERYRGYLTGCGFVYSLLEAVPFLGIPMTLVAECGAACVVADIVKRNLEKGDRMPLVCEDAFNDKTS